jgi:3-deoxy-D-manno-octulosonate 8-phosphate phosphatase (KDO 8-P phosphatase)
MPPPSPPSGKPASEELKARAAAVKLLVFDVDGVLTDGGLYYGAQGEALKRFDVKDGHGLVLARLAGLPSAVLTARTSEIVQMRGKELQLVAVLQGRKDKVTGLTELVESLQLTAADCAYMGDDVNDLGPMAMVGLPCCPSDAALEVRQQALFVSSHPGGRGAARELVELCLKARGSWDQVLKVMRSPQTPAPGPDRPS